MNSDGYNRPLPRFNPGDAKALHAVGVISLTFVQFECGVDTLFLHHSADNPRLLDEPMRVYAVTPPTFTLLKIPEKIVRQRHLSSPSRSGGFLRSAVIMPPCRFLWNPFAMIWE
jgi:hypothetical protein